MFGVRKYTCPFTFTDVSWSSVNREKDSGKLIDCVKLIVGPIFDQFSPILAQKFIFNVNLNFEVLIILLENSIKQVIMIFWMFQNQHLKKKWNLRSFISQKFTIQTLGAVQSNFNFCKMLLNIWKKILKNEKLKRTNMKSTPPWFLLRHGFKWMCSRWRSNPIKTRLCDNQPIREKACNIILKSTLSLVQQKMILAL